MGFSRLSLNGLLKKVMGPWVSETESESEWFTEIAMGPWVLEG